MVRYFYKYYFVDHYYFCDVYTSNVLNIYINIIIYIIIFNILYIYPIYIATRLLLSQTLKLSLLH